MGDARFTSADADVVKPFDLFGSIWSSRFYEAAIVVAVMIFALALRLLDISDVALWNDEGWTLWFAQRSMEELTGPLARVETNPILYYILIKAWIPLFGDSAESLRMLSVLFSVATIIPVYIAGRLLVRGRDGVLVGALAAMLFAMMTISIRFAVEARAYAMFVFAIGGACAASIAIFRSWADAVERKEKPGLSGRVIGPCLWLGFFLALAIWSHNIGVIYAAVFALVLLVWWVVGASGNATVFLSLVIGGVFGLLLASFEIYIFLFHTIKQSDGFWLNAPDPITLLDMLSMTLQSNQGFQAHSYGLEFLLRFSIGGVFGLLGLYAIWKSADQVTRFGGALLVVISLGTMLLITVVTYLGTPILLARTLAGVQPAWVVILAMAPLALKGRWRGIDLRGLAGGALAACFGASLVAYMVNQPKISGREDWSALAQSIEESGGADRATRILTHEMGDVLLEVYLDTGGYNIVRSFDSPIVPDLSTCGGDPETGKFECHESIGDLNQFASFLDDGEPSWIVVRGEERIPGMPELLKAHGLTQRVFYDSEIALYFAPAAGD